MLVEKIGAAEVVTDMIETLSVIIYKDKAYVPTEALLPAGPAYVATDPVYVAELTPDALAQALEKAFVAGHAVINPTDDEWYSYHHGGDPLLRATGARSWKTLARHGAVYAIVWSGTDIILYLSEVDKQGRFASGPGRTKIFHSQDDFQTIAHAILEDAEMQPSLQPYHAQT